MTITYNPYSLFLSTQTAREILKNMLSTLTASWREAGKTRNVHLGSSRKMDGEAARRKAREMKAEALGMCFKRDL